MSNQPNDVPAAPSAVEDPLAEIWQKFEVRDENLHDLIFVVEGRQLYASQRIVATASDKFQEMLGFDVVVKSEPDAPPNDPNRQCRTMPIEDIKYEFFRSFLALMYHEPNVITESNCFELAYLSSRFWAFDCSNEVEKCIISLRFDADINLDEAQKWGLHKLKEFALHGFTNAQDVLDLERSECYDNFNEQTKSKILDKYVALNRNQDYDEIILSRGNLQTNIGGVPWETNLKQNGRCFEATVECKLIDATNPWMCEMTIECLEEGSNYHIIRDRHTIRAKKRKIVFKCCTGRRCRTPRNVDIRIRIYPMTGRFREDLYPYADNWPNISDVVVFVENQKFPLALTKQFLAHHSTFFYSLFYGSFKESNQNEVKLGGITITEFSTFIGFIYVPSRIVTKDNFDTIMKMADMYNVRILFHKCEEYLKIADISDVERITLSQKHNLKSLFEHVVSKYKKSDGLQQLSEQHGFDDLPDDTIGQIARKLLKKK